MFDLLRIDAPSISGADVNLTAVDANTYYNFVGTGLPAKLGKRAGPDVLDKILLQCRLLSRFQGTIALQSDCEIALHSAAIYKLCSLRNAVSYGSCPNDPWSNPIVENAIEDSL